MAKALSIDDLPVPDWFADAGYELKPMKKSWAKGLPSIKLASGDEIPITAIPWIFAAMAYMEAEAIRHDLIDNLKRYADVDSLDEWTASALNLWIAAEAPVRDGWLLPATGYLGRDRTVVSLQKAVRLWSRGKQRTFAVIGVDALKRIGTKAALEEINTLASGIRDQNVATEAQASLASKARQEGKSREEVEDEHVSLCGLSKNGEREFDFGPRNFRAALSPELKLAIFDKDGRLLPSFPRVCASDNADLAGKAKLDWSEMKSSVDRVVKAQIRRFEQAMITGRPWRFGEFRRGPLQHPIVSRIARLLVWQDTEGATFRVTEDLSFATREDNSVEVNDEMQLRIAHPLRVKSEELLQWTEVFSDYKLVQPFQQITRPVYRCDPSNAHQFVLNAPSHEPIKPAVLYGILDNDSWRLSPPEEELFRSSWKTFPMENTTVLIHYSGLVAGRIAESPLQTISDCSFHPGLSERGEILAKPMLLGQVPPLVFSETMRRLERFAQI